jgi:hypothetical protein
MTGGEGLVDRFNRIASGTPAADDRALARAGAPRLG